MATTLRCIMCGEIIGYHTGISSDILLDQFLLCPECMNKKERGDFIKGL